MMTKVKRRMAQQSESNSQLSRPSIKKINTRTRGLLMLIIGLGLAKWQIYDPLHALEQGIERITVYSVLVGLAVLLSVFGSATLVIGDRLEKIFEDIRIDPKRLNWKSITILLLMTLVVGSTWVWILLELSAQGYR
jgi:hypothetical protein